MLKIQTRMLRLTTRQLMKHAAYCTVPMKENKLLKYLHSKIEATGPISVAEYMKEVLISPYFGYYMSKDVFGSAGDFITSPEISQLFGEMIGVWFYNEWQRVGRPSPFQLVEFGPGRGTLTDDLLRVFSKFLPSDADLSIHFVEVSPHLCQVQKTKLCLGVEGNDFQEKTLRTKHGFPISWHRHLETVPEGFSLFLAHEFFDAMPILKFQKTENGWREVLIDCKNDQLQFVISREETPAVKYLLDQKDKRDHVEISPDSCLLLENILKRMKEDGGISLIVDYGHLGTKTDTFRAFKNHKVQDPLQNVGEADLTADIDFSYLSKHASNNAVVIGPVTQEFFLKNMGIEIRLKKLLECSTEENQKSLKSGFVMLTCPSQMGERFKFMALYPMVLKDFLRKYPPPGFS